MKRFIYIFSAALVVVSMVSCQKSLLLKKPSASIVFDEENTYMTGDPQTFYFDREDYNVVFFSGEVGHQYKYHERGYIYADDVDTLRLTFNIQHRSGYDVQALEIYYTDSFEGFDGIHGEQDMQMLKEMYEGGMQGWEKFPYVDYGVDSGTYYTYELELDHHYIENLCIAFYWNPSAKYYEGSQERADTYWVTGSLDVVLNEVASYTKHYDLRDLVGTVVMMNEIEGTYYYQDKGDGSIQLNATTILFQGGQYNAFDTGHSCEGWLVSDIIVLNEVDPDTGDVAKSYSLNQNEYSYTYYSPGTYHTAFLFTNANYLGLYRELVEMDFVISGEELERPDESENEDE